MGRGRSGLAGGGNSATPKTPPKANTPSGISHDQFMKMSDSQKFQTIQNIVNDQSIKVPAHLDASDTTKVMYALGMNNKPKVVTDSQLDAMPGKDLYRTVYEGPGMPPPSSSDVLDQIRTGDFTQLSGRGGSAHGRALYFARDSFTSSSSYGAGRRNSMVMRAKINPNAKIVSESKLRQSMQNDPHYANRSSWVDKDSIAMYAISHGIDGWYSGNYTMIVNRGALTASAQNKSTNRALKSGKPAKRAGASSWAAAANL